MSVLFLLKIIISESLKFVQGGAVRWDRKEVSRWYRKEASRWYSCLIFSKFFSEKGRLDGTTRIFKKKFLRLDVWLKFSVKFGYFLNFFGVSWSFLDGRTSIDLFHPLHN